MKPTVEQTSIRDQRVRRIFGLVVLALMSVTLLGCGPKTVWSTQVVSPDGRWIAGARTEVWSGPGVGTVESTIYLARSDKPRDFTDVISYPENPANPHPQITWESDDELVVRVPNPTTVDLQMIKLANIRIRLEALPNGASAAAAHIP
jgi:hypothetical protein